MNLDLIPYIISKIFYLMNQKQKIYKNKNSINNINIHIIEKKLKLFTTLYMYP